MSTTRFEANAPSLIQIFDCAVNSELKRLRGSNEARNMENVRIMAYVGSQAKDISCEEAEEEFLRVVKKLRLAEASVEFEDGARAAYTAVSTDPCRKDDERIAADAIMSMHRTKLINIETIGSTIADADKVIEVIGYVGITKPRVES